MKNKEVSSLILISYTIIFSLITLLNWGYHEDYWKDSLTAAICCLMFLFLHQRIHVHPIIATLEGAIFIPNQMGLFFLYGMKSLNYHGDWIIHFSTALVTAIVLMHHIRKIKCIREHVMIVSLLSFSLTVTGGSMVELLEYWGFIFFGYGSGFLGFGVGDNSQNFGPWENSSLDVTFNFLGSAVGIALYFLYLKLVKDEED